MAETPQEYIQRILGNLKGQDPPKVQARTANTLQRLIKGLSAPRLRKRPAPNKWSVAEILAHLADCEIAIDWRLRQILAASGTTMQPFDQDAWAATGHYPKRNPHNSLEQFRALRKANLDLLKSLTPEQWEHYGMNAERGKETLPHFVRLLAGHDLNHTKQIERILKPKNA